MYSTNTLRHLQAFLLLITTVFLSSTVFATDRNDLTTKSQTAGAQISGIDVRLEQVSGSTVLTTKTDEKGSFTFSNVAPGSYKLRIGCAKTDASSPGAAGRTVPEKGQDAQKCYTEIRIVITEKSTGVITGAIRKES